MRNKLNPHIKKVNDDYQNLLLWDEICDEKMTHKF